MDIPSRGLERLGQGISPNGDTTSGGALWLRGLASALAGGALLATTSAWGGGFQIPTYCVKCQGSRNAGAAASADTASILFFNPAGLTRLAKRQAELGLHFAQINTDFSDDGSTNPFGGPAQGLLDAEGDSSVLIANFYLSQPGPGDWSFGLGVHSPYGLNTDYPRSWVGRYHGVYSEVVNVDINPALAYRINPRLSVGAGLDLVYAKAELTNAVDFGSLLSARLGGPIPALGITPGNLAADGYSVLDGDDWGLGWNLGVLFELDPATRLGASYRSKVDLDLDGESRIEVPYHLTALTGGLLASEIQDTRARLTLPATLRLGVHRDLGAQWSLLLGAEWTNWSDFREIRVRYADGRPDFVDPQEWHDVWRFSIGAEYRYSPKWSFRTGFEYDESPIPQATKGPRVTERDLRWLALGASYAVTDSLILDLAYNHAFIGDYSVDLREVTTPQASGGLLPGNRLVGDYSNSADILSLGARWSF
ncbi:MAG: OmpP1/FadL family transporter [Bdellovibrio bacteriovorus]